MLLYIPYRFRILSILCLLTTLTYLDRICISIVGVRIKSEFSLNNEQFGWILAAFSLAYALFEIPSGWLGDRFGPKKVFIRIVWLWSVFTAFTGLASGLLSLIVIRFLFGVGESGTYPNAIIAVSRWFPVSETGRALTWVGIGSQIGSAIAPLLITPIAIHFGWRMSFYTLAFIGLVWIGICYLWFKDFPDQFKNIHSEEKEFIQTNSRYRTSHSIQSLTAILKHRNVWMIMGMYFCYQWAQYFFVAWMPIYLQQGRGFTETQSKPIITFLFLAGILGFFLGGFFSEWIVKVRGIKVGRRITAFCSMFLCAIFTLIAAFIKNDSLSSYSLMLSNFAFAFGVMTSYAVCADIGKNNTGTVTGAMNFAGQMGAFFLALLFGKIADLTHSFQIPLFVVACILLLGSSFWFVIDPEKSTED